MTETFSHGECDEIPARCSYQKLKLPHRKTNQGLRAFKSLKTSVSLNAFKHNLKDFYFRKGNKKE